MKKNNTVELTRSDSFRAHRFHPELLGLREQRQGNYGNQERRI